MGLSMTMVLGAVETIVGDDSDWAGTAAVAGFKTAGSIGCAAPAVLRQRGLRAVAPQADLDRAVGQVERGQIVALHETNEGVDPLDIERLGRTGGILRHAFTPHKQTSGPPLTPVVDLTIFAVDPRRSQRKIHGNPDGCYSSRTESSDLAMLESTSQPSGVTSTSSSIRMPPQPGR